MLISRLILLLLLLIFLSTCSISQAKAKGPYALRISCGSRKDIRSPPTNTLWYKDFAYTGGIPANATRPSYITPPLSTLRYFPLSEGPENCYNINRVPSGHYLVRIFYGLVDDPNFDNEPLFDISVEGTLVDSLAAGWSNEDDEHVFTETIVFLTDGTVSLCFHSTGHGNPAILSIEIQQVNDKAYNFGPLFGKGTILKTVKRFSSGQGRPKFGEDYGGDPWGGDRFFNSLMTFGQSSDKAISVESPIKKSSIAPNFYPQGLYQSALVSTDVEPELTYSMDVEPNSNYSIWLHFAEIDPSITKVGQRVFDILINGDVVFKAVDVVNMSGDVKTALVLNTTVAIDGRTLTINLKPISGSHAIISAFEVFLVLTAEAKTSSAEVSGLQSLKKALQLPHRLGWNGDPCVPRQHPWNGADCRYDGANKRWYIDGLGLDNQGLHGFLPRDVSKLSHLQSINLSGNSIRGTIPPSLGTITTLEILDLSYNFLNGSIPETLGQLHSLQILNLNGNKLYGRVPAALSGRLLHRASFNFTDNAGLCGIPGLRTCGPHLSLGAKVGITIAVFLALLLIVGCSIIWWKRRQNILRAQRLAAREAPYAKKRTQFSRDVQMTIHNQNSRTASEDGPILLS
ncbi:receptor-like protein kinase At5g59670 [Chenopodium quinoa]|uniref:Malectin-like domain-containing protein n=1 Tax=Chenopodium quinoa TaxID=63459 RepID=A0A803LLK6_CHEQI|nr:receptor-like protein kinase At5g59670 [Chenopodium quinoa]